MTRSSDRKANECHVLDFLFNYENRCDLFIFHNGARFHIVADPHRMKAKSDAGKDVEDEYNRLVSALQAEVEQAENPECFERRKEAEAAEIHNQSDDGNGSQDSGHATDKDEIDERRADETDSAVDVSEQKPSLKEIGVRDSGVVLGERRFACDSETILQNWMLAPFGDIFKELAPASEAPKEPTLKEWYNGPSYFFNLYIEDDHLSSERQKSSKGLEKRITDLVPRMPVPKYIKDLDIPWVNADDITVIEEGTEPIPYHPTRVKVGDKIQFLKMVDMSEHSPTKREIKLLKQIEDKGLHKQINVPQIFGLVYDKKKTEIMGFLQTDIEEATPLTKMLDSDVVEDNRRRWARESERIIEVLHKNNIIWGDAKADNFMVDKHNKLWIIDFGGSYTDGWVDPDLAETVEGDDMGTEKIANALRDPEANTFDPADQEQEADDGDQSRGKKRSRDDSQDEEDTSSPKRRK